MIVFFDVPNFAAASPVDNHAVSFASEDRMCQTYQACRNLRRMRSPTFVRRLPFALAALFAVVVLFAVIAYVVNAWQVYGFAKHVWKLPTSLAFAIAIGTDLLSLACAFATYLLRAAKLRVRAYAWLMFFGMTGLSFGAAESFAQSRNMPALSAHIASGAIVVALTAAVHLLIVCVRHVPRVATLAAPAEASFPPPAGTPSHEIVASTFPHVDPDRTLSRPATPAEAAEHAATAARRPATRKTAPPSKPASAGRRGRPVDTDGQRHRDQVAHAVLNGRVTKVQAADQEGKSVRSIEKWIESFELRGGTATIGPADPEVQPVDDGAQDPLTAELAGLVADPGMTRPAPVRPAAPAGAAPEAEVTR